MGIVDQQSLESDRLQSLQASSGSAKPGNYEYLPHTADIQLHSWGADLPEALGDLAKAMFGYMTDLNLVHAGEGPQGGGREISVEGHDLHTMVFAFLDEWLYRFHDEGFVGKEIEVYDLDEVKGRCKTRGVGEVFDMKKHKQGTEVKAITYSNMQVIKTDKRVDVYVIIDI
ncbi:hypothetical protein TrRE_jg11451 [Triparma retinervis]|uniref:Protein archease-like n=1 Tax=Triparma retinervis TaxID=2557542 RepID=A0A9W7FHU3_9STRA|nr:hypothetical protein TrRE_jg11451 [Triparma retinervis]